MEAAEPSSTWPAPPPYYLEPRRPPPPPIEGPFTTYGVQRPAIGSLPPVAPLDEMLYDASAEPCGELRKLNRNSLRTFLELLQTLQDAPSQSDDKGASSELTPSFPHREAQARAPARPSRLSPIQDEPSALLALCADSRAHPQDTVQHAASPQHVPALSSARRADLHPAVPERSETAPH